MLYGIIADIHANLEAFRAVLDELRSVDRIICLGDIVGYGPEPGACIELMKERDIPAVAGNHDKAAVGELSTQWFNEHARRAIEWTAAQLTAGQQEYLRQLPLTLEWPQFQIVHGSLREPLAEYLTAQPEAGPTFELMTRPLLFVGHTHQPLRLAAAGKEIINPGGVGQPRDGDPRASFGVYDPGQNEFILRRIDYDIPAVQAKMKQAGLPRPLIERLQFGR